MLTSYNHSKALTQACMPSFSQPPQLPVWQKSVKWGMGSIKGLYCIKYRLITRSSINQPSPSKILSLAWWSVTFYTQFWSLWPSQVERMRSHEGQIITLGKASCFSETDPLLETLTYTDQYDIHKCWPRAL